MDAAFLGSWKLDPSRNEGMETFGKVMKLSEEQLENYKKLTYVVSMSKNGEEYTVSVDFSGVFPNQTYTVKIGEPIDYKSTAGHEAKLTLTIDGNNTVETYKNEEKGFQWTVTRSVSGNEMTAVTKMGDATLKQVLLKI